LFTQDLFETLVTVEEEGMEDVVDDEDYKDETLLLALSISAGYGDVQDPDTGLLQSRGHGWEA